MTAPAAPHGRNALATGVGLTAVAFSALYLLSDVLEGAKGGFSDAQLWLTLVAEAAIPLFVIGLYAVQRPLIGRLGRWSAIAYAYSYVYFTGTVAYALLEDTKTYGSLSDDLQPWMTIHGAIMVVAGLGFGAAVIASGVLPRWTGVALMVGVIAVAATQDAPEITQMLAAGVRDVAFAGMGLAVLRSRTGLAEPARSQAQVRSRAEV